MYICILLNTDTISFISQHIYQDVVTRQTSMRPFSAQLSLRVSSVPRRTEAFMSAHKG
jgi:hypothetical protein